MREIKFRAWNKQTGTMANWSELKTQYNWNVFDQVVVRLMQATGLKDKNGVEIYEGDILSSRYEPASDRELLNQVVQWADSPGAWVLTTIGKYPDNAMSNFFGGHPRNWEVIGNIYVNPELLK